ncbi:GxxExxY protein [Ferruginibacter sp. SUN106]|uniref:GxxExxY protein n=1 Tax=Ferruginibacter sp. SUN106 TaxID=2978348 RepID=UPI003D35AFB9
MTENEIATIIIGCAIDVHRAFGPGLLESAYRECLHYDLTEKGLFVAKEKPMPIVYKEVKLDHGYRMDLLVENKVVVELKRTEAINDVHIAQLLTYLKLGNYKLGLIINFQNKLLKDGIKRLIN